MTFVKAISQNWFYTLLPAWVTISWALMSEFTWQTRPALGEAITLSIWCILVPATFALCYRNLACRALFLRIIALFCGGIWLSEKIVPNDAQIILMNLNEVRWLGLLILIIFEAAAVMIMLRMIFGGVFDPRSLEQLGVPPIVGKLMLIEVKFWRWLFSRIKGA